MSGVAFAVTELTTHQPHGAGQLYFCCQGCSNYFTEHRDRVLARRGWPATP